MDKKTKTINNIILEKRKDIIKQLSSEGFNDSLIAGIMNANRSWVYRIRKQ